MHYISSREQCPMAMISRPIQLACVQKINSPQPCRPYTTAGLVITIIITIISFAAEKDAGMCNYFTFIHTHIYTRKGKQRSEI